MQTNLLETEMWVQEGSPHVPPGWTKVAFDLDNHKVAWFRVYDKDTTLLETDDGRYLLNMDYYTFKSHYEAWRQERLL